MTFASTEDIKPFQHVSAVFCVGMNYQMSEPGLGPMWSCKHVLLVALYFTVYQDS